MSHQGNLIKKLIREMDNPYHIGEDSDSDDERDGKSSEDEAEEIACQSRNFIREQKDDDDAEADDDDSDDDFEKEMEMDLDAVMLRHSVCEDQSTNPTRNPTEPTDSTNSDNHKTAEEEKQECYDEDYFSSGSEDENAVGGVPSKSRERRKILTDDDLFYDPDMDDEDEKWVLKQRQINREKGKKRVLPTSSQDATSDSSGGSSKQQKTKQTKVTKPPTSDAVLSCPACMTIVCIDCQRHDIYKNQYRAMFTMNCTVVADEVLKYQEQTNFGKKRRGKHKGKLVQQTDAGDTSTRTYETYHPVKCSECGTEVAVYDSDEVYHFFNILTSYA